MNSKQEMDAVFTSLLGELIREERLTNAVKQPGTR